MIDKTVDCGNINSIEITRDKVMKVEIVENKKLGLFEVVIDGVNFGVFEDSQSEQYAFFPRRQDRLTGDHYIAIGNELNKINKSK